MIIPLISFSFSIFLGICVTLVLILVFYYFFFIYDFKADTISEDIVTQTTVSSKTQINEIKSTPNDELWNLFESKEKIAREMIEKKFPSPQITNSKFNGVLDNCKEVVESQVNVLNSLTPTEKTKYKIKSRKKLIKQIISKVDDLTNELILRIFRFK